MIDKALEILKNEVESYLTRLPELNIKNEKVVYLSPVARPDGQIAIPDKSLGIALVNIEEERVMKSQTSTKIDAGGKVIQVNPEIKLNLYILIAANFSNYNTGIEYLSGAIRFFQAKNVFTLQNTPALHPKIQKLVAELYTLSFEQQNHLWGALGARYLPSIMYRIRLITIDEAIKMVEREPITIINLAGRSA